MSIVTRKTAKSSPAALIALADQDLIHVIDRLDRNRCVDVVPHEGNPDVVEVHPWSEIPMRPSVSQFAIVCGKVALPANAFSTLAIKFGRIDDGIAGS